LPLGKAASGVYKWGLYLPEKYGRRLYSKLSWGATLHS
jgi:hypothetical protein